MNRRKIKNPVFTKEQLMNSNEFLLDRDIIQILADKDKAYTKDEIKKLINGFRCKEVI